MMDRAAIARPCRARPFGTSLTALLLLSASVAPAAAAQESRIVLEVQAPQRGDVFACGVPVTIRHGEDVDMRSLHVIAKVYENGVEMSSTGIKTGNRPIIRNVENGLVSYEGVSLQFDLTERQCDDATGIGIVFARCTFENGETVDCLDRIAFEPSRADGFRFFIGEAERG